MAVVASMRSWSEVQGLPSYNPRLPTIAAVVTQICMAGDSDSAAQLQGSTVFDTCVVHPMSISDYLLRLCKHAHCSPAVWILYVALIDRWTATTGRPVTSRNVFKLSMASFVVAAKLRDDVHYSFKYYGQVGGVSAAELRMLENQLLRDLSFNVAVTEEEYQGWSGRLRQHGVQTTVHP
eukprot:TRINITY_DN19253_c0_g1_i1.p1 TRINITY_DN19253_c0_g1~~TRINITY_DN19253_c0_g1_i1.p1  ORF type:complete len:209 (+),score=44.41 TRINITY_DN19253_c0_g1_i1:92-628(+)